MEDQSSRADAEHLDPEAIESSGSAVRDDEARDDADGEGLSVDSSVGGDAEDAKAASGAESDEGDACDEGVAAASGSVVSEPESPPVAEDGAGVDGVADASAADVDAEVEEPEISAPEPVAHRPGQPLELIDESEEEVELAPRQWYIIKVQTNREASVRRALIRRIKMMDLEESFGEIVVPEEKVTEVRGGKKRVVKRKLFPGYVIVHMSLGDDAWHLVRGTSGVGDFTGSGGKPTPMPQHEVDRIVVKEEESQGESPKLQIAFVQGDRVKINEGTFDSFEGEVESIDEANGRVTVIINIFGRSTPVELEYWQIESL